MHLTYPGKKSENAIFTSTPKATLASLAGSGNANKLIQGENLAVLHTLLTEYHLRHKVSLVYIDPPFATNGHFTISEGRANTVSRSKGDALAYSDTLVGAEFLEFLRERLLFLRELMAEEASIYLHIDYKIGHYVKIIMDEVFGRKHFRNDITRIKCNPKNFARKGYGNIKDLILFYSKAANPTWHEPKHSFTQAEITRLFQKTDKDGRRYTTIPLHAPGETANGKTAQAWKGMLPPKGRHWRSAPAILEAWDRQGLIEWSKTGVPRKKLYADEQEGKKVQDIWEFKDPQYPSYPTEKNLELLKLIISASSNEGDLILDCFCGSGTSLVAAQALNRRWIGIDQSAQAIQVAKKRLATPSAPLFSRSEFEVLVQQQQTPSPHPQDQSGTPLGVRGNTLPPMD